MKSKIVLFFLLFLFPELIQAVERNWYEKSFFLLHIDHHTTDKFEVGRDADPVETMRLLSFSKPDVPDFKIHQMVVITL